MSKLIVEGAGTVVGVTHPAFFATSPKQWAVLASAAVLAGDLATAKAIKHRLEKRMIEQDLFEPDVIRYALKLAK